MAPGMSAHVVPPSFDRCHCTVGAGAPTATEVNVVAAPISTVRAVGWVVTVGALVTVSTATLDTAVPDALVTTARYCDWSSSGAATTERVVPGVPVASQVVPPSSERSQAGTAAGALVAVAVNVAVWPTARVRAAGLTVTVPAEDTPTSVVAVAVPIRFEYSTW
ncbi:MAG: hypothetical protein R2746_03425 [Acidimicrobiales bacterium]